VAPNTQERFTLIKQIYSVLFLNIYPLLYSLLDVVPVEASGTEVLVGEILHALEESPTRAGVSKRTILQHKKGTIDSLG
jgi:hypothetical protein